MHSNRCPKHLLGKMPIKGKSWSRKNELTLEKRGGGGKRLGKKAPRQQCTAKTVSARTVGRTCVKQPALKGPVSGRNGPALVPHHAQSLPGAVRNKHGLGVLHHMPSVEGPSRAFCGHLALS